MTNTRGAEWAHRSSAIRHTLGEGPKESKVHKRRMVIMAGLATVLLVALAYVALWSKQPQRSSARSTPPPTVQYLTGVVRDFLPTHPDFNVVPSNGYGQYCGNIAPQLDSDGKPKFVGGGFRVAQQWRDKQARPIAWCIYSNVWDDKEGKGQKGSVDSGAITSAATYAQWYRDVPGVNMSRPHTLTLTKQSDGMYEFITNDFHPIDGALLGNDADGKNLHFTFEIDARFVYDPTGGQDLDFMGDDDIWVFIDDRLVIDMGGIGANSTQHLDLKRLNLTPGKTYIMKFFHAERKQPKSQFRIKTNILFEGSSVPTITDQYD